MFTLRSCSRAVARMIYFDNNATTAVLPGVFAAMQSVLTAEFGNPSSSYSAGRAARVIVEDARGSVAALVGAASPDEVAFTSGGTESDNWAIIGALRARPEKRHLITTRVEHEAVRKLLQGLEKQGYRVTWLDVGPNGQIDIAQLRGSLSEDTAVVSIMLANNETGVIFPVAEAAEVVKRHSTAYFHTDAVNAAGKIRIDVRHLGVDLLSISAHKFHGPKGIGALYIRRGTDIAPYFVGGGQERGRRAGTEAVHQIAGIGAAAETVRDLGAMERVRELRDRLEAGLLDAVPGTYLNGSSSPGERLPNTSNISFANTNGEAILAHLDQEGICVSTGSACNSETRTASPVLAAMDVPYERAMGSIRFSLGRLNTEEEVDTVLEKMPPIIERLRAMAA